MFAGLLIGSFVSLAIVTAISTIENKEDYKDKIELNVRFNSNNEYLKDAIKNMYTDNPATENFDININISDEKIGNGLIKNIEITYKQNLYIPFFWTKKHDTFKIVIDKSVDEYIKVTYE